MTKTAIVARIPEPFPGLVFRYDFLRPWEYRQGIENGKERPACVLVALAEGEILPGTRVIDERTGSFTVDYVAKLGDVLVLPIQSDAPGTSQAGIELDTQTKRLIGLSADRPSYVIVSEVNIDGWPNAGIKSLPGKRDSFAYPGRMPQPKMAAIARAFLEPRKLNLVSGLRPHP